MTSTSREEGEWIDQRFARRYSIAARLASLARAWDVQEISDFWEGWADPESLLRPWSKKTVVHTFATWVAHGIFYRETSGPYARVFSDEGLESRSRALSVDTAFAAYGLDVSDFEVPPPHGEWVKTPERNINTWEESDVVANACYEHFTENIMWSEAYDRLLDLIADEVFHVVFNDRQTLAGLNEIVALKVLEVGGSVDVGSPYLTKSGRIRRRPPPPWAMRAVFHRDRGRCAMCERDLSGLIDSLKAPQFDHIVPLAAGGVNDVSNLQLSCEDCNRTKSANLVPPSTRYRRWFAH